MLPGEIFIEGERVVAALVRHGFVVYRSAPVATICERGLRAVAVPRAIELQTLPEILRMTGLSAAEIGAIRADVEQAREVFRPSTGRPSRDPAVLRHATQPTEPKQPRPEPHVPRPVPSPNDPPSPNAPQPRVPEVPSPPPQQPAHPEIPSPAFDAPSARV
jgi:hypothetical protein